MTCQEGREREVQTTYRGGWTNKWTNNVSCVDLGRAFALSVFESPTNGQIHNVVCMGQQRKAMDLAAALYKGIHNRKHRLAQEGMDLAAALCRGIHNRKHHLVQEGTQRPFGHPRDHSRR